MICVPWQNIRSALHARSGSPLMINHLTSTYARNWGLTTGVGVWLKVYLQELMVHVSCTSCTLPWLQVHLWCASPVFLALQIIAICINKKTHLSCKNNRRLNKKWFGNWHDALATNVNAHVWAEMITWQLLQNWHAGGNWCVGLAEKHWHLLLRLYIGMQSCLPTVIPIYRWLQAIVTYQEADL